MIEAEGVCGCKTFRRRYRKLDRRVSVRAVSGMKRHASFPTGQTCCAECPHAIDCAHARPNRCTNSSERVGVVHSGFQAQMASAGSCRTSISTRWACRYPAPDWFHGFCWHGVPLIFLPGSEGERPDSYSGRFQLVDAHTGKVDSDGGSRLALLNERHLRALIRLSDWSVFMGSD